MIFFYFLTAVCLAQSGDCLSLKNATVWQLIAERLNQSASWLEQTLGLEDPYSSNGSLHPEILKAESTHVILKLGEILPDFENSSESARSHGGSIAVYDESESDVQQMTSKTRNILLFSSRPETKDTAHKESGCSTESVSDRKFEQENSNVSLNLEADPKQFGANYTEAENGTASIRKRRESDKANFTDAEGGNDTMARQYDIPDHVSTPKHRALQDAEKMVTANSSSPAGRDLEDATSTDSGNETMGRQYGPEETKDYKTSTKKYRALYGPEIDATVTESSANSTDGQIGKRHGFEIGNYTESSGNETRVRQYVFDNSTKDRVLYGPAIYVTMTESYVNATPSTSSGPVGRDFEMANLTDASNETVPRQYSDEYLENQKIAAKKYRILYGPEIDVTITESYANSTPANSTDGAIRKRRGSEIGNYTDNSNGNETSARQYVSDNSTKQYRVLYGPAIDVTMTEPYVNSTPSTSSGPIGRDFEMANLTDASNDTAARQYPAEDPKHQNITAKKYRVLYGPEIDVTITDPASTSDNSTTESSSKFQLDPEANYTSANGTESIRERRDASKANYTDVSSNETQARSYDFVEPEPVATDSQQTTTTTTSETDQLDEINVFLLPPESASQENSTTGNETKLARRGLEDDGSNSTEKTRSFYSANYTTENQTSEAEVKRNFDATTSTTEGLKFDKNGYALDHSRVGPNYASIDGNLVESSTAEGRLSNLMPEEQYTANYTVLSNDTRGRSGLENANYTSENSTGDFGEGRDFENDGNYSENYFIAVNISAVGEGRKQRDLENSNTVENVTKRSYVDDETTEQTTTTKKYREFGFVSPSTPQSVNSTENDNVIDGSDGKEKSGPRQSLFNPETIGNDSYGNDGAGKRDLTNQTELPPSGDLIEAGVSSIHDHNFTEMARDFGDSESSTSFPSSFINSNYTAADNDTDDSSQSRDLDNNKDGDDDEDDDVTGATSKDVEDDDNESKKARQSVGNVNVKVDIAPLSRRDEEISANYTEESLTNATRGRASGEDRISGGRSHPEGRGYEGPSYSWTNCASCGVVQRNRIVGGRQASIKEFPWMVAVRKDGVQHCGASIINHYYLLTAAHCLSGHDPTTFTAIASVTDVLDKRAFKSKVEYGVFNKNFDQESYDYDVAILKLAKRIPLGEGVVPICLPAPDVDPTGHVGMVSGWGALIETATVAPEELWKVGLPIVTNEVCQKSEGLQGQKITERMMCAGFPKGTMDACAGDSGGPMVWQNNGVYEQVGIVSWGIGCARPKYFGVYTRVTKMLDWITQHVPKDTC